MNVFIIAVCMNIAIVKAGYKDSLDLSQLIEIIKGERIYSNPETAETDESLEALPLMPGFFMTKPKSLTKTQFKYPLGKVHSVYHAQDSEESKEVKTKSPVFNPNPSKEYLMAKILKGVKNLHDFQEMENYRNEKAIKPTSNIDSTSEMLKAIGLNALSDDNYLQEDNERTEEDLSLNSDQTNEDDVIVNILDAFQNTQERGRKKRRLPSVIVIKTKPSIVKKLTAAQQLEDFINGNQVTEYENDATEIMDNDSSEDDSNTSGYRRSSKKNNRKKDKGKKNRSALYSSPVDSEDEDSGTAENEKNPGNPFTIHKNKYKTNWMWNHYMDGDHMNINPLGPQFASHGPSGADLFFGRKWWYYNQDDYKPLG